MTVCQQLNGESEYRQKFLETISSVEVFETPELEIAAAATLVFWEDVKQQWLRKSLQAYSSFIF